MVLKHDLQHSLWTQPHLLQLPQADEHTIEYPVH